MKSAAGLLPLWLFVGTPVLRAQTGGGASGGKLSATIEYSYFYVNQGQDRDQQYWLTGLILWRTTSECVDEAQHESGRQLYRAASRAAEDSARVLVGGYGSGIARIASYDHNRGLYLAGQRFTLPDRDSALVLMAAVSCAASPQFLGSAWIRAQPPQEFWPRTWASGDTMFFLRRPNAPGLLERALRTSPVLAAFIDQ